MKTEEDKNPEKEKAEEENKDENEENQEKNNEENNVIKDDKEQPKNEIKEEEKQENKVHYIYFTETHQFIKDIRVYLSSEYEKANSIERLETIELKKNSTTYITSLYRFVIYNLIKENNIIKIFTEDKGGTKNEVELSQLNPNRNTFLFDLNSYLTLFDYKLKVNEEFDIYMNYLEDKLKIKKESEEYEDLMISVIDYLSNNKNEIIEFSFYIKLFLESYHKKYFANVLELFNSERIKDTVEIEEEKIDQYKNMINKIDNEFKEEEKFNQYNNLMINFYTIIYYFYFKVDKEKLETIMNDKTNVYIKKGLIQHKNLFKKLVLPKNLIIKLIKTDYSFDDLTGILSYSRDFLILLEIINENIEYFNQSLDGKSIDIEKIVVPKSEDDLQKIQMAINTLFSYEKKYNKKFISLFPNIIDKYIGRNISNNEQLFIINNIINDIKKNYPKFTVKSDIDLIIHNNYLNLAKNHKMNNIEILDFIKKDKYYNDDKFDLPKYRKADVISGIDLQQINNEFMKKWYEMDFVRIFNKNYLIFANKVCDLVKDISYFRIIFELLNNSKDPKKKQFGYSPICAMQQAYEKLLNTYTADRCTNFVNDTADLIYFSDRQNYNQEKFLTEVVIKNVNKDLIDKIFCTLVKYPNTSEPILNKIIDFYTDNWNLNVNALLELINKSPKIKGQILSKLGKYLIQESEFFELKETNNYKLLSGLVKSGNFKEDIQNGNDIGYIEKTLMVISSQMQKIKDLDINFNIVSYFIETNNKQQLYERLLLISLLDEKEAQANLQLLVKNVEIIESALDQMQSYLDEITLFFRNKYYKDINELHLIIKNIKLGTIKDYTNKYVFEYNNYITRLREDFEKIGKRYQSSFFITVYNNIKNNNLYDDDKAFRLAIKSFEKMKDIFSKNKIEDTKDNILEMCLMPFVNREEELKKEIDIDIVILNLQKVKDKFKLFNDLVILIKRKNILKIAEDFQMFINKMQAIKTDFSKNLDYVIKKLTTKNTVKSIQKCIDVFVKYNFDVNKNDKDNNIFYSILHLIKNQPSSIDFLFNNSIEDCRTIQELPGIFENGLLTMGDILNLEKCIDFMNKFGNRNSLKMMKDIDIIKKFKDELLKNKNNVLYFTQYINNFPVLNDMMTNDLNRAELSKNLISLLLSNSEFTITNINNKFFNCIYFEPKKNNKDELTSSNLSLKELFETRDRAQLNRTIISENDENAQLKEKIISNNKKFIEIVSKISNIYGLFQDIYWKGFPQEVVCKIKINNSNVIYNVENKDYDNFEEVIKVIKDLLEKIKIEQILGYRDRKLVRYFFGLHFDFFYKKLNEPKQKHLFELMPFLNYCTNESIKVNLSSFSYKKSKNRYQDIIINCDNYLKELLKLNQITYESIYKNTIINKRTRIGFYKGIYIFLSESLEKEIFQIYRYFTKNNPVAQNILLCNKDTSSEEIIAFLYRAILCELNSCFIIGGIESLVFEKRKEFLNLINILYVENYQKMRSCLIILHINETSEIYKWLKLEKSIKKLTLLKADYERENYLDNKIEIIYSDKSGVGKSRQIKEEILKSNKTYIYFPFGGVLDRNHILERLKRLELNDNCVIHLDLYDTDQISLMMEFLFSVLITKVYGKNENIFYLSKYIKVKIEIPNSFIDFFAKFPVLDLFPKKKLSIDNLAKLIVPKEITSNIQIISNYLKDIIDERINQKDLYFPGITPEIVKDEIFVKKQNQKETKKEVTATEARILSQGECEDLILDVLKEKIAKPTYYQINTFIDILAEQIKKFNQNYYLCARQLRIAGISYIRTFIINSFINLTEHFTRGAFTELLNSQIQTHKKITGQYDEGKDIDNAIGDLANNINKDVISFDKIDPSLLFFHEGEGQSFSIITNKDKNCKEYKDLLALKNSQALYRRDILKELPNYKKYTQKQFLAELKDILDIKNPVEKTQGEEKISLEEIAGNYVFTADNFVKMALILLRIRSNIPVIMMGETGCGKTSLIRKLSELKNDGNGDKMKILNIHAGTTDLLIKI